MPLTIFILLVILLTLLIVGTILLLVFLLPAIGQLKKTLADLEQTSSQVRVLSQELAKTVLDIQRRLQTTDQILHQGKKFVEEATQISSFIQKNFLKRTAGIFAFLPAVKFGWKIIKKIREGGKDNE